MPIQVVCRLSQVLDVDPGDHEVGDVAGAVGAVGSPKGDVDQEVVEFYPRGLRGAPGNTNGDAPNARVQIGPDRCKPRAGTPVDVGHGTNATTGDASLVPDVQIPVPRLLQPEYHSRVRGRWRAKEN